MRTRWFVALGIVTAVSAWALACTSAAASPSPAEAPVSRPAVNGKDSLLWIEMQNVNLRVDPKNAMRVRTLRGQVIPTTPGTIAVLDDPSSFSIRATSGVVALDGGAITSLLNNIAFNYPGAPLKGL